MINKSIFLVLLLSMSQFSLAGDVVHVSSCTGTAVFEGDGAFSRSQSSTSSMICWLNGSSYGSNLDVDVRFKQNLLYPGSEGLRCRATSYSEDKKVVHKTSWVRDTESHSGFARIKMKDSSVNSDKTPKIVKVECELPPNHTTDRGIGDYGAEVFLVKLY